MDLTPTPETSQPTAAHWGTSQAGIAHDEASRDEYMLAPVPRSARRPWWSMLVIVAGFGYLPVGLIVGGQLAGQGGKAGLTFPEAALIIGVGAGVVFLIACLLGYPAMTTGLNLAVLSRYSYGKAGIGLPMAIMAVLAVGWFASIVGMVGDIFTTALGELTGITVINGLTLEHVLLCLFWGVIFTWAAWKGIVAVERISVVAVPVMVIVTVIAAVTMLGQAGGWSAVIAEAPARSGISIGTAITMVLGAWMAGAIMAVDLFRYAGRATHVLIGAGACFILVNPLLNLIGYVGSIATGDANFIAWMVSKGVLFTLLGVIVWVLALWTTDMSVLYCDALYAGSAAHLLGWHWARRTIVIVLGTVGTILGAGGFTTYFTDFITVLGAAVIPMAGPLLADFYLVRRREYAQRSPDDLPAVRLPGLLSFLAGAALGIVFQYWVHLPLDLPAGIVALVITFALHLGLSALFRKHRSQQIGITDGYAEAISHEAISHEAAEELADETV